MVCHVAIRGHSHGKGGEGAMDGNSKLSVPKGFRLIFRAWKRDKDGNKLYAKDYGLRGWPLFVPMGK